MDKKVSKKGGLNYLYLYKTVQK